MIKFIKIQRLFILSLVALFLLTCSKKEADTTVVGDAPSDLSYGTNLLNIEAGKAGTSAKPTLKGASPFTFSIISVKIGANIFDNSANLISIDKQTGIVTAAANLATGLYSLSISVQNQFGTKVFENILTLRKANAVFETPALVYATKNLELFFGTSAKSVAPTFTPNISSQITKPTVFKITSKPSTDQISIDQAGVISVSAQTPVGIYQIDVDVEITVGDVIAKATYSNAYNVNVKAESASALLYSPNSLSLLQGNAGSSVAPSLNGTKPFTFALTSSPATDQITINANTGVISASSQTAVGIYKIRVKATNLANSVDFADVFTVNITENVVRPSNLVYQNNSLETFAGTAISSVIPSLNGTKPIVFGLSVSPANGQITINQSTGVVSVSSQSAVGTYVISVNTSNSAGSVGFPNILTVIVKEIVVNKPSNLTYNPSTLTTDQGTASSSSAPNVQGNAPITFGMTVNPANANISINANTGVISASASVALGTYNVSVSAINLGGTVVFNNALTIVVKEILVSNKTTFSKNVKPILEASCGGCHAYSSNYAAAKSAANSILNRVQIPQGGGGMMPRGGQRLSESDINVIKQWITDGLLE